jgi:hypothetical protein
MIDRIKAWVESRRHINALSREARAFQTLIEAALHEDSRLIFKHNDRRGRVVIVAPKIQDVLVADDRITYRIPIAKKDMTPEATLRSVLPPNVTVKDMVSADTVERLSSTCDRKVTADVRDTAVFFTVWRIPHAA